MVIEELNGKIVFLDTAPLIYYIEGHSDYQAVLTKLFKANDNGYFAFITSAITLLEVLVMPYRLGREDIAKQYRKLLTDSTTIDIVQINDSIAINAAKLRAMYNIKTPDAIQLATCLEYEADYFLTNDFKLKSVAQINVFTISQLK